ncbi:MAG: hypothetical protein Q4D41_10215, partial [Prevotellaceae bacterium]|nr:hypothetical protein [Prevotellaceae bacterium]
GIYIILSLFIFTAMTHFVAADNSDSILNKVDVHTDKVEAFRDCLYDNPAMQSFRHSTSLNNIYVGYSGKWSDKAIRPEYGTGYNKWVGHIDAYIRKKAFTMWGKVLYTNGQVNSILYNESSDFDLVYPYVMADTVGGNTRQEYYYFLGGFSYQKNRFTLGVEGSYEARMEYRTRDPRPKNLTGDLKAKVGATYDIDNGNLVGLAVSARRYKQTNDVELYSETSVPVIYHATGLGTDYYRFRGVNTSTYYKGYSFGSVLDYARKDKRGLFASFGYDYLYLEKIISDLNELPMAEIKEHDQSFSLGYSGGTRTNAFGLLLTERYTNRKGTENIFGTAQSNIYPQISSITQYERETLSAGIKGVYRHSISRASWNIALSAGYTSLKELYAEPVRKIDVASLYAGLTLGGRFYTGQFLIMADAGIKYVGSTKSDITGITSADGALSLPVLQMYDYYANDRIVGKAKIEADYSVKDKYVIFASANWEYSDYSLSNHYNMLEIAIGVKF